MEKGQGKGTDTLQTDNVFTRKEYIERESFIENQRHLYCENCERRKVMKNGKMKFVYNIGDVLCRACDIGDMLDSLEDYVPAADVVEVVRCKDCKHYVPAEDDGEMMCVKDADWCVGDGCYYGFTESHDADWFCADGEKRADNG